MGHCLGEVVKKFIVESDSLVYCFERASGNIFISFFKETPAMCQKRCYAKSERR